jgi:hypothetical protein
MYISFLYTTRYFDPFSYGFSFVGVESDQMSDTSQSRFVTPGGAVSWPEVRRELKVLETIIGPRAYHDLRLVVSSGSG